MTILSLAQTISKRLQLSSPTSFIGSSDGNLILIQAMMEQTVQDLVSDFPWPELQKQYSFTLATSTDSYALPGDFDRFQTESLWNSTQKWPLIGPLNAREWQTYKSGLVTSFPRQRYRVKDWGIKQFFIDPTPSSSENGQTIVFEYISKSGVRPKTWVASTSWTGIQYCSYNGNIYNRGSTGAATTGTTAPTHTSGSASDGSITWTYLTSAYESFIHDTDEIIIDEKMIVDGAVWRFKRERGEDYEDHKKEAQDQVELAKTRLGGAQVLTINNTRADTWMLGPWAYPEGNY